LFIHERICSTVPGVEAKYLGVARDGNFIAPQSNGGVDERFIPLYGITLLAGRNFLPDNPADERSIIISRSAAARMGWRIPDEAIGQQVSIQTKEWTDGLASVEIIGVIEDYKLGSLFSSAGNNPDGVALIYKNHLVEESIAPANKLSLLVESKNIVGSMRKVEALYNRLFPGNVFSWNFLDQQINLAYHKETTTRNQITFFTCLAILIACVGLLGMITNKVVEKTKEIGIRQVLGAAPTQLVSVLLKTTLSQIVTAILLGIPAAWLLIEKYFEKFSDRIPQQWWHYALPVIIFICIMSSAVAYSVLKAVRNSPVRSLRYE
jgi:putative ABC transport system permease protein